MSTFEYNRTNARKIAKITQEIESDFDGIQIKGMYQKRKVTRRANRNTSNRT